MKSKYTYVIGVAQVLFGLMGLIFGWVDGSVALGLITSGIAVFGLTQQNVKLGNALGHAI